MRTQLALARGVPDLDGPEMSEWATESVDRARAQGDAADLRIVDCAGADAEFAAFAEQWRGKYPAMIRSWERMGRVRAVELPVEPRKIVYTTNASESLNARFRRMVRHRGHFPNEQAALKVLYLVATRRRKNRQDLTGRINRWKQILNTLSVHYGDRIAAAGD